MRPDSLGVIGVGAIGGSLAWQAARAGIRRVIGYAEHPREAVEAARAGAIHEVASSLRQLVRDADLVVLAGPPAVNLSLLSRFGPAVREQGTVMTDVTSVKAPIMHAAARLDLAGHFAGSHPFAGTHGQGFAAARPDLLRNAVVYVTPLAGGDRMAREVADFWATVCDAQPVTLDAAEHDRRLARASHLPQVVASALAATLARRRDKGTTVGPGARDTTRLAASSEVMWRDILLMNREQVLAALDEYEGELGALRQALCAGDVHALTAWLSAGARWRRGLG